MFSNICVSGGGLAAISYLGCLKYINENKELRNNIKNILGVSSGSIFSLFILFDLTYDESFEWLHKITKINLSNIKFKNLIRIKDEYGLDSSDKVIEIVKSLFDYKKIDHDLTFKDVGKIFGKNLIICTANLTKRDLFYFSIDTTPEVKIIDAIKASTSIPILFTPFNYKDEHHVDAFIYDNFPIQYFEKTIEHTFGLNLRNKNDDIDNVFSYFSAIFDSIIEYHSIKKHKNECIIDTDGSGFNFKKLTFEFKGDDEMKAQIDEGYKKMKKFIEDKVKKLKQNL